ncbi:MAG: B12-binding domain-containing radical SAM protein [Candidatus Wallbacteria bacterium HGW-Wallbacteria-1]|jgi:radical SAM superfamily enzyme YgiQ (UPF0313 family)|uniref:B12-binding domain-containing radical SAM protein n=1 Tax=Candidatus Wallbacteria bacterium HGW-Wallbacteria-1 TaxID=2013854 RepID=A0A2N1PMG8_9BACT|nr:MAG: B12-binding domain-containing radical SAM protein [Candidatus Wallbacteria bacterium HGW-Wallbacteria-1]
MRILILNPPFVEGFCRSQRWAAKTRARVMRHPDGLATAAALLRSRGHQVSLIDGPAANIEPARIPELTLREKPDMVVVDSTTPSIFNDIACCHAIKNSMSPPPIIIMVGPHASALPRQTLELANGAVDAIAAGEYDETLCEAASLFTHSVPADAIEFVRTSGNSEKCAVEPGKSIIPGLWICRPDRQASTLAIAEPQPRPFIADLDSLPFPAWDLLDLKPYYDGIKLQPFLTINGSRGCPYRCSFCLWPQVMHGRNLRLRSPESIVSEMEWGLQLMPSLKKGEFFFEDDTFTARPEWALSVAGEIGSRLPGTVWSVNGRADLRDESFFRKLARNGLRMLLIGFESGNQDMLDSMQKGIRAENFLPFTRAAKAAGITLHGCFVLGMPGETEKSMEETIQTALSLPLDTVQFSAAVPFPGTRYYDICVENGWISPGEWQNWLKNGEQAFVPSFAGLQGHELEGFKVDAAVDRALKSFYFRPSWMAKFILGTRDLRDLARKARGGVNFLSYLMPR